MRYLLFLLALVVPSLASALIVEAHRLEEINSYVKPNTVVLLNIDAAVVDSALFLGSDSWYSFLKDEEIDSTLYYQLILFITPRIPLVGIEDTTATTIGALQKRGFPVFGFTGRGREDLHGISAPHYDGQTQKELIQVGVNFALSPVPKELQGLPELKEGVFFAGDAEKGAYLKEILERTHYRPNRIIFVSKPNHLASVETAMAELGIDFVGIKYEQSRHREDFDLIAALIQFKILLDEGRAPSNAEAVALKQKFACSSLSNFIETLLLKFRNK